MPRSVSPVRNAVLWLLALFSGALAFLGTWVVLDRLPGMEAVLDDGTATTAQVYGGQSWVVVGAAVLAAGLVGLALTLAVAARLAARPPVAPASEVVESPVDATASADSATLQDDVVRDAGATTDARPVTDSETATDAGRAAVPSDDTAVLPR